MKKYLLLLVLVVLLVPTLGCTTQPDPETPRTSYHFSIGWSSNSSNKVDMSGLNLSNESISQLVFAKFKVIITVGGGSKSADAKVKIAGGKLTLDFFASHSYTSHREDNIQNDVTYNFTLEMVIESDDPAVSGLVLFGEENKISGEFTPHDDDMTKFETNVTDPVDYGYIREDSGGGRVGEVTLDLGPGHFLTFELDLLAFD